MSKKAVAAGVSAAALGIFSYIFRYDIATIVVWTVPGLTTSRRLDWWYQVFDYLDFNRVCAGKFAVRLLNLGFGYENMDLDYSKMREISATLPGRWAQVEMYGIQLYDYATRDVDFKGKTVAEVSCGRGGGSMYLAVAKKPLGYTGIDYSEVNVNFARVQCKPVDGLEFIVGDAGHLPLKDASCDVVLNIEASSCYPDLVAFFREARRVLRSDGVFVYVDLFQPDWLPGIKENLAQCGFNLTHEEDITENVVLAIRRYGPGMAEEVRRCGYSPVVGYFVGKWLRDYEGNTEHFKGRQKTYFIMHLRPKAQS